MKTNAFIVLFSAALLFIVYQMPFKAKFYGDWTFHAEAKALAAWVHGQASGEVVAFTKAPGPVLFYGLPYVVAGAGKEDATYWKWALAWNLLWLAFALILIKKTAELLFGGRAGIAAVILAFLLPLHLYYGIGILAETMAFVGFTLFAYGTTVLFLEAGRTRSGSIALIAGLLFMVTARPNSLLILALLPVVMLWLWRGADTGLRARLGAYLASYAAACVLTILLSVGIRYLPGNQAQALQESYFVNVAHQGRFQFRTETWDWRFWESDIRPDSKDYQAWRASSSALQEEIKTSGRSRNEVYGSWLLQDAQSHPFVLLKQFGVRLAFGHFLQISSAPPEKFAIGPLKGPWIFYGLHIGINLFNLLLIYAAIVGFFRAVKTQRFVLLLIVPWLALSIFHGMVYMEQRYMFPARPVFLLLASPVLVTLISRLRSAVGKSRSNFEVMP